MPTTTNPLNSSIFAAPAIDVVNRPAPSDGAFRDLLQAPQQPAPRSSPAAPQAEDYAEVESTPAPQTEEPAAEAPADVESTPATAEEDAELDQEKEITETPPEATAAESPAPASPPGAPIVIAAPAERVVAPTTEPPPAEGAEIVATTNAANVEAEPVIAAESSKPAPAISTAAPAAPLASKNSQSAPITKRSSATVEAPQPSATKEAPNVEQPAQAAEPAAEPIVFPVAIETAPAAVESNSNSQRPAREPSEHVKSASPASALPGASNAVQEQPEIELPEAPHVKQTTGRKTKPQTVSADEPKSDHNAEKPVANSEPIIDALLAVLQEPAAPPDAQVQSSAAQPTAAPGGERPGSVTALTPPAASIGRARAAREASSEPPSPRPALTGAEQARFVHRVARAFQVAQQRDGEIRLRLSPPELGSMRLDVKIQDGVLTARLDVDTSAAKAVLVDNMPALRERLAEQNIRVEQFEVQVGGGNRQPGAQGSFDERSDQRGVATPVNQVQKAPAAEREVLAPATVWSQGKLNVLV
jgi:flagellar hook-length control protein FliK